MPENALLVVALRTDQPNIARRLDVILNACQPIGEASEAQVIARPVDDLVASDLDRLAAFFGWDGVRRLGIGDVVAEEAG